MATVELIAVIIIFGLAGFLLVLAIMHFKEEGVLLNNAYLYASKELREKMDKKPYYRQSAIIFCILSAVFLVVGLSLVLHKDTLVLLEIPLIAIAMIYAIVSTVQIGKKEKR